MFKTVFHTGWNLLNRGYGRPIFIIKQVTTIFWNGISAFSYDTLLAHVFTSQCVPSQPNIFVSTRVP